MKKIFSAHLNPYDCYDKPAIGTPHNQIYMDRYPHDKKGGHCAHCGEYVRETSPQYPRWATTILIIEWP